jgi:hypothetical protein
VFIVSNGAFKSGSTWLWRIAKLLVSPRGIPVRFRDSNQMHQSVHPGRFESFLTDVNVSNWTYLSKNHVSDPKARAVLLEHPRVRVLNITRDIRDVLVSAYFHDRREGRAGGEISEYWKELGRTRIRNVLEHHRTWNSGHSQVFVASYESLQISFEAQVLALGAFLDVGEVDVEEIAAATDFAKLRKGKNDDAFHRKGIVGDWRNHLSAEIVAELQVLVDAEAQGVPIAGDDALAPPPSGVVAATASSGESEETASTTTANPGRNALNRADASETGTGKPRWRAGYRPLASRGRRLETFPDDVFLVSYPRSGNLWTRFLVAGLRDDAPPTFESVRSSIPGVYLTAKEQLEATTRPRIIKSHERYDQAYPKVVYIVRDPRELAPSYLRFLRETERIPTNTTLEEFVPEFVRGNVAFGSWEMHVRSWLEGGKNCDRFLLVRYEDMRTDAHQQLRRIAEFTGLPADDGSISRAVEWSSRDRMRALEAEKQRRFRFVGEGNSLAHPSRHIIKRHWGATMRRLGYASGASRAASI